VGPVFVVERSQRRDLELGVARIAQDLGVKALAPERAAEALGIAVLPWAAGLSKRALLVKLRLASSHVGRIGRGERTVDMVKFIDIAEAVGLDPVEVFRSAVERQS